jgi:hypothetical protein
MNDSLTCPAHIAEALRRAGGDNDYGEPNYRLIHAAHARFEGGGMRGGRLKYPVSTRVVRAGWVGRNPVTGQEQSWPATEQPPDLPGMIVRPVYEYQDTPRNEWVLESWIPPEIICLGWESSRYLHKSQMKRGAVYDARFELPDGRVDVLGEMPRRGEYRFLMYARDEHERPMAVNDARLLDILALALKSRSAEGTADYWREQLPDGKARRIAQRIVDADRSEQDALEAEFEQGFADLELVIARQMAGLDTKYSFASA